MIRPLAKNDSLLMDKLAEHDKAIASLMHTVIEEHEDHKKLGSRIETVCTQWDSFQQERQFHESTHRIIDEKIARIESDKIEAIEEAVRRGGSISEREFKTIDQAIERNPTSTRLIGLKGLALGAIGNKKEALNWIDESVKKLPKEAYLWYVKGILATSSEESLNAFDKALGLLGDDQSEAAKTRRHMIWLARAGALMMSDKPEESFLSVEKSIEFSPSCATAWTGKGNILRHLNRLPESLGSLEQAIKLDPEFRSAYYERGQVLSQLGRYDEAIASFDKYIKLTGGRGGMTTWCKRALLLHHLRRNSEALESVCKALDFKHSACYQTQLFLKIGTLVDLGRTAEALDLAKGLDETKMDNAAALGNYAWVLYKLRQFERGIGISRRAIEKDSSRAFSWNVLACNLEGAGRDSEASEAFEKALALRKDYDDIEWEVLAEFYERIGRHDKAEQIRKEMPR